MTSLRAVVVALVAVAAACAAPARAQTTMGDATSADTERGNVAGLDESAPCCRICPGLFYSVKVRRRPCQNRPRRGATQSQN